MRKGRSLAALGIAVLLCFAQPGISQSNKAEADLQQFARQQLSVVNSLWGESKIDTAVTILESLQSTPGFATLADERISTYYNLACGYSLLNLNDKALASLAEAIGAGFENYRHIERDSDLDNIRDEPRFAEIVNPLKSESMLWEGNALATPFRENLSEDEKVAGLSELWSEIRFGFAYFDRVPQLPFDSLYLAFLPKVRETASTAEYYRTLQSFCSPLNDGHTSVDVPNELFLRLYAKPPLETRLIEGKVIVTDIWNDSLRDAENWTGYEVMSIDGIPVKEYAEKHVAPYVSFSTKQGWEVDVYGYCLLCGDSGEPVGLELRSGKGKSIKRTVPRNYSSILKRAEPVELRIVDGNIAYVVLNSFGSDRTLTMFDSLFPEIERCDGLVIDVRSNPGGNSSVGWDILGYLVDQPMTTTRNRCRDYRAPYRAWGESRPWFDDPAQQWPANGEHCYRKPVMVLTGAMTGSAAEDFCVAFDQANRGLMIGQPTNGSTGQPLSFQLPGGGMGRVCTLRSSYANGTEYVGKGIQPDILIEPSVDDVRIGRDGVLDTAVKEIKKNRK